jgi:hypothetical protein
MFGPSLKSVPGCLVSIVPMLIGEPVAFTPGLGPHDDVSLDPLLAVVELDELVLPPLLAPGALLVLLLLLPHPARIAATPITAAKAAHRRARGTYSNNLTDLSSSSDPGLNPPRFCEARAAILIAASVVCKTSLT